MSAKKTPRIHPRLPEKARPVAWSTEASGRDLTLTAHRTAGRLKLSKNLRQSRQRTAAANWRQITADRGQLEGTKFLRGRRAKLRGTPPRLEPGALRSYSQKLNTETCVCLDWLARQRAEC
ncbi:hypothetical protein HJG60_009908 [Phyllostomus discolor]|uniref:Uncharacterized protein n=1 Tax=Phyllostomus discolor TaxID=89673 RepID=A0A834ET67_9CHIR|nr:hypothetical protein HJG60_009908 [Phyllostomus discolor]